MSSDNVAGVMLPLMIVKEHEDAGNILILQYIRYFSNVAHFT